MYKTSLLTFAIALVVLTAPFLVSAQTMSDTTIQTDIQSLMSRIDALKAELKTLLSASVTATTGTADIPCFAFQRSLSQGIRGGDVAVLQQFLIDKGYSIPSGATWYFGAQTKMALVSWQVANNVALSTDSSAGIFGPRSRAAYGRSCGVPTPTPVPSTFSFSADPEAGVLPLAITFTSSAPIANGSSTFSVDFGDKSEISPMTSGPCIAITAIVGGQGGIRCSATIVHTYTTPGTYTARLIHNTCPEGVQCFVGPQTVATKVVTVTGTTIMPKNVVRLNAPGTVTFGVDGIAEIRNVNAYFTLTKLTSTTATIQPTPVGCWNSFPSDTPPQIVCMIAVMRVLPETLTVGQMYRAGNYAVTLTAIENNKATFSVAILSTL